ncbi:MAG: PilZ domain-containing protein [Polyangiales bacterium]
MSDPRMTAKTAREGLAQGLQLLQTPGLPPDFLNAAEPIARAMGALMTAERSDGSAGAIRPQAEVALAAVRDALSRLQGIQSGHPAAEQAMAAVAGSLGHVHGLSKLEAAPAAPAVAATQYAQQSPGYQQHYQPPPAAPQFQPVPAPQPQFQAPPPPAAPQFAPQAPAYQATQLAQPPVPQFNAPPAPQAGFNPGQMHSPSLAPGGSGAESLRPPSGTIEAELGAHSSSNFYKTLSGNDIVEHGGLFVATYNVPKMGQRVQLRVHLPGGYHFDAAGTVRWTRESTDNPDAPPGFGVQFQGVTAEQRQLIMRYVRNREPLFYDDL